MESTLTKGRQTMRRLFDVVRRQAVRAWLYRVGLAVAALAGGYGLLTEDKAVLWIGVLAALLGNGVATVNTRPREPRE